MTAAADLSFPIGRFESDGEITADLRDAALATLERMPERLRKAVETLSDAQLDTRYRPGRWTVRQLVHHMADSHMNAYARTKLALTEDTPTIKPYDQDAWAALADVALPVDVSLRLLETLHQRWTAVWRSLSDAQFSRALRHPEIGLLTLDRHLQLYAWHSRHHLAHVTALRAREGW